MPVLGVVRFGKLTQSLLAITIRLISELAGSAIPSQIERTSAEKSILAEDAANGSKIGLRSPLI